MEVKTRESLSGRWGDYVVRTASKPKRLMGRGKSGGDDSHNYYYYYYYYYYYCGGGGGDDDQ
jgi:hypothetical protein